MGKVTEIREVNIADLKPYERNAKKHSEEQVEKLCASIREFGFISPCLIDEEYNVIAGHGRIMAARDLGMESVPCLFVEGLTEEQRRAYILADNRLTELGEWDMTIVNSELMELDLADFDISVTGFDFDLGMNEEEQQKIEEAPIPDVPEEPTAKRGDIYQLGNHVLMCGDSTDTEDIARLMGADKAKMLFTSPPYSDMREYEGGKDLSVANLALFIAQYAPYTNYQCINLGLQRKDGDIIEYWNEYIRIARESGYKLLAWNVWDKCECGSIGMQSAFVPIRHEWVFIFGTEYYDINKTWEKKEDSITDKIVWHTVRQKDGSLQMTTKGDMSGAMKKMESVLPLLSEKHNDVRRMHPATFPVGLPGEYINAMTAVGDIVIEPFGGSGTTLIACESLNRRCRIMELEPKYVDVIIARWENMTGMKAVLLNG